MNPISTVFKDYLVAQSIGDFGGTDDWSIYISKEPQAPDKVITIFDVGGPAPGHTFDVSHKPYYHTSIQLRVRGTGYEETYVKIVAVAELLKSRGKFTDSGIRFERVSIAGDYINLPQDDDARYIFVVNLNIERR